MQITDPFIMAYVLFVSAVLGLVAGSFVNCWAWRFVRGESIMRGRSHCASCNHVLGVRDLVPVFSWLAAGGKCRYCGRKVSARYPAAELVCACAFLAVAARYGLSLQTLELFAFCGVLLFLSLTDLDEYIIPNGCIAAAVAIRAAYWVAAFAMGALDAGEVAYYLVSAVGVGVVMLVVALLADRLFGRESMGFGDLKLYAVAGLYFGWQQSLFLVIVSCIVGIVAAFAFLPGPADPEQPESILKRSLPFGPSIAVACVVIMLAGEAFVTWYLGFL